MPNAVVDARARCWHLVARLRRAVQTGEAAGDGSEELWEELLEVVLALGAAARGAAAAAEEVLDSGAAVALGRLEVHPCAEVRAAAAETLSCVASTLWG